MAALVFGRLIDQFLQVDFLFFGVIKQVIYDLGFKTNVPEMGIVRRVLLIWRRWGLVLEGQLEIADDGAVIDIVIYDVFESEVSVRYFVFLEFF